MLEPADATTGALKGRIPNAVLDRPKQGFHLPIDAWLAGPLQRHLRELASNRNGPVAGFVDLDMVSSSIEEHARRRADRSTELWFVLMLDSFLRHGAHASGQGHTAEPSRTGRALETVP